MSFNGPVADLHRYLQEAREAVLWKAEGLSEYAVRRPLTPTGTNLLGLVKHLSAVEFGYFGDTFGRPYFAKGEEPRFHWTREPEGDLWARPEESRAELVGLYRAAWAHTDAVLAELPLDTEGRVPWWPEHRAVTTLHHALVRVLAETQRHAGHADILREQLDGRAGAGRENTNLPGQDEQEWSAYREQIERAAREADPAGAEGAVRAGRADAAGWGGPLARELGIELVEVDGRAATADDLLWRAVRSDGHFTAAQVRGGKVRGVGVHLERLRAASRELWGEELDPGLVRERVRHALGGRALDAALRVYVHRPAGALSLMVTLAAPGEAGDEPLRVRPVPYVRPFAHVKHLGGFAQTHHRRLAGREGYDEVLLTGPDGEVAEGGITNVLLWDGARLVLPTAPALAGTTLTLLEQGLPAAGIAVARRPVHRTELAGFRSVFLANSRGIVAVREIDGHACAVDEALLARLRAVYEAVPWEEV